MKLHYGIIGMGPIGSTIATLLAARKHRVSVLLPNKDLAAPFLNSPVEVSGALNAAVKFEHVYFELAKFVDAKPDIILIAIKSYDASMLFAELKKTGISKETIFISCQNGLDVEKNIESEMQTQNVLRMVLNMGAAFEAANKIRVNFNFMHVLSKRSQVNETKTMQIAADLNDASFSVNVMENYQDEVFKKVILNSSLSSICAITQTTMSAAIGNSALQHVVKQMVDESCQIGRLAGFKLPADFETQAVAYMSKGGDHKPSMGMDIEQKRPTENESHCGKLVEYARKVGFKAPVIETVYLLLKGIEQQILANKSMENTK